MNKTTIKNIFIFIYNLQSEIRQHKVNFAIKTEQLTSFKLLMSFATTVFATQPPCQPVKMKPSYQTVHRTIPNIRGHCRYCLAVDFNKMTSLYQWPACGRVRWGRSASQLTASNTSAVLTLLPRSVFSSCQQIQVFLQMIDRQNSCTRHARVIGCIQPHPQL